MTYEITPVILAALGGSALGLLGLIGFLGWLISRGGKTSPIVVEPRRSGICFDWRDAVRGGSVRESVSGRLIVLTPDGLRHVRCCPFCGVTFYDSLDCPTPAGIDHRRSLRQEQERASL